MEQAGGKGLIGMFWVIPKLNQRGVDLLLNGSLVILAGAAWAAYEMPSFRTNIAFGVLALGTLVSVACHLLRATPIGDSTADHAKANITTAVPVLTTGSRAEIQNRVRLSDFLTTESILRNMLAHSKTNISRNEGNAFVYNAVSLKSFNEISHCDPVIVQSRSSIFNVNPHDSDNYTVNIGLVSIVVKNGVTNVMVRGNTEHRHRELEVERRGFSTLDSPKSVSKLH